LRLRETGIKNKGSLDILSEFSEDGAAEGGLPGADFTRELDEPFPSADPVHDMVIGFAMLARHEEIMGIRRDIERRFLQFIEIKIHGTPRDSPETAIKD
jgi:hypothetical protein